MNQFLVDWGIGLVVFGADYVYISTKTEVAKVKLYTLKKIYIYHNIF